MALQTTGTIEADDINVESRKSASNTFSLDSEEARTTANKISSGSQIAYSDFYGRTYGAYVIGTQTANTPYVHAYAWSQGFGTKYTNPGTTAGISGGGFNWNKTVLPTVFGYIHGSATNVYTSFYAWTAATGFGTRYTLTGTFPNAALSAATGPRIVFAENNTIVIMGGTGTSPNVGAFAWSDATGFGTKFADPATIPNNPFVNTTVQNGPTKEGTGSSPIILGGGSTSIRLQAYNFSTTGWGTRMTLPSSNVTGAIFGAAADGSDLFLSTNDGATDKYVGAYRFDAVTGFGTKYAAPAAGLAGVGYKLDYSWVRTGTNVQVLAYAHTGSPYVTVYDFSGAGGTGFGSKYSNPVTLPAGDARQVNFNTKLDIIVGHNITPFTTAYPWSTAGFGTKYADPGTLTSNTNGAVFGGY